MSHSKLLWLALAYALAGCNRHDSSTAAAEADNAMVAANQIAPVPAATPAAAGPAAFSIDNVPISNAPLGKFPYFGLPARYAIQNQAITREFGRFPFWTGKDFVQVEGKTWLASIVGEKESDYSAFEIKKNMETLFAQAGAVKIFEGRIPYDRIKALPEQELQEINTGFGDAYNNPAEIWVIRRPDTQIWIHFAEDSAHSGMTVVETKPFVATASLLPADQLKADLDKNGKAVIHVNFATDQSAILPGSRPQVDAVVALLKQNPQLKLAINGYTDETGSDAHNLALSDGRAKAVMASLVAAGISAARLQAKGYGKANPVAPNGDEAGKAANRRVELIKL